MENFNSFEDILVNAKITADEFAHKTQFDTPDEVAYKKLKLITKAFNGDWVPDYTDRTQAKWEILFYHNETEFVFYYVHYWFAGSHVCSRLCFKSRKDAEKAVAIFINEYRAFLS